MLFNKTRAMAYMERCGVDVLVAASPVNITYFSGYYCWIDPLFREYMMAPGASSNVPQKFAVFPLEGEPALVVGPDFATNAADLWVRDLHIAGNPVIDTSLTPEALPEDDQRILDLLRSPHRNAKPTDALLSILKARGLTEARIGVEMEGLAPSAKAEIAESLPKASIMDCSDLIRLIRMVKTEEELARLTRAAEISEEAGMESLALARAGKTMAHVIQHYRERIGECGADLDHFMFGVNGLGFALERDYVLKDDDMLYVDWGCIYQHYFSDTGTTLAIGEPSAVLRDKHAALRECVIRAVDLVRPGVKSSEVRAVMWNTLNGRGITATFPHGHGMGLEVRDYPIIVADNGLRINDDCVDAASDLPFEENMVINLEAMTFMPGVASPHIEQSFVVTAEGCRPLCPQDRSGPVRPEAG
jgi:Xaa-Pro aminopeptidase